MRILKARCIEIFPIQEFLILKILNAMIFIVCSPFHIGIFKYSHKFWTNHMFSDI
jgi:hypothetical protein